MCSAKSCKRAIAVCILILPPLLFQLFLAPKNLGSSQIVDHRCSGLFRAMKAQYRANAAAVGRLYEGGTCVTGKEIDTDKIMYSNFGDLIGPFNALLQYEVCFDQETSLDNSHIVSDNVEQIVLEKYNRIPPEMRVEAESGKGFEVVRGGCALIQPWAQGKLHFETPTFTEYIDINLFELMKEKRILVPTAEDPEIFENPFFIEDTTIIVKPRYISIYVYLGLLVTWGGAILFVLSRIPSRYREYLDVW